MDHRDSIRYVFPTEMQFIDQLRRVNVKENGRFSFANLKGICDNMKRLDIENKAFELCERLIKSGVAFDDTLDYLNIPKDLYMLYTSDKYEP